MKVLIERVSFGKTNKEMIKINGEGISELRCDKRLRIKNEFVEQYMKPRLKKKKTSYM